MTTLLAAKAALLALVRGYPGQPFDADNSSRDDWHVLDSGRGYAAVVTTEGDTVEGDRIDGRGSGGIRQERHTLAVNVVMAIGTGEIGLPAITTALETLTEALKDYIRPSDRLNGAADGSYITRTTPPGRIANKSTHYMQTIVLTVYCSSAYPFPNEGGA